MKKKVFFTSAIIAIFAIWGSVVLSQSLSIEEIKRRITPAHEILLEYEKLKFDMTPVGIKVAEERAAEEARLAAERVERERREAEARRIAEGERRAAEVKAAAERAERERREAEEKRIAEEKRKEEERQRVEAERKAKREEMEKNAVELREEMKRRGDYIYAIGIATFGNRYLQNELKRVDNMLRTADQFEDKVPLQQAVETVQRQIREEREKIAKEVFFTIDWESWTGIDLAVDRQNDKASFMMRTYLAFTPDKIADEVIKEISFQDLPNVSVASAGSGRVGWELKVHVSGDVASIQKLWQNAGDYQIKVYFNNLRSSITTMPSSAGTFTNVSDARGNIIAIDIIKK